MKMKHLISMVLSILAFSATAQYGYKINVKFEQDINDEYVYLAHYFAKPMPTIYKTDSAKVINKRSATFERKDSILGGIYMVLFNENTKFSEMILNNGESFSITIDTMDMPNNISFKGSKENEIYSQYSKHLSSYGRKQQHLNESLIDAKNEGDTTKIRESMTKLFEELNKYRKDFVKKHPDVFIAKVLKAMQSPEVPEGNHYLEDGKTVDTMFAYRYFKDNYWNNFDFNDNRLIHTPVYDGKLNEYFTRLVLPVPDSMIVEADALLAKARPSSELFKYTLHWLTNHTINNDVMGLDEVYVHLVENYHMKGDAFWLDSSAVSRHIDRAGKIAPNLVGSTAADLALLDIWTLQENRLSNFKSQYTVLIFWDKDCNHCVRQVNGLDSLFQHGDLAKKGVGVYSVPTKGELADIQKFVNEHKINYWQHSVATTEETTIHYKENFDVYSTPKVYLLDQDKKIIGKKLGYANIIDLVEWHEKKTAKK